MATTAPSALTTCHVIRVAAAVTKATTAVATTLAAFKAVGAAAVATDGFSLFGAAAGTSGKEDLADTDAAEAAVEADAPKAAAVAVNHVEGVATVRTAAVPATHGEATAGVVLGTTDAATLTGLAKTVATVPLTTPAQAVSHTVLASVVVAVAAAST